MIDYKDFSLTDKQIENIKKDNALKSISKYIKENGTAPSNIDDYYVASEDDIERYRRIYYCLYLENDSSIPSTETPSEKEDDTTEENSASTIDSSSTIDNEEIAEPQYYLYIMNGEWSEEEKEYYSKYTGLSGTHYEKISMNYNKETSTYYTNSSLSCITNYNTGEFMGLYNSEPGILFYIVKEDNNEPLCFKYTNGSTDVRIFDDKGNCYSYHNPALFYANKETSTIKFKFGTDRDLKTITIIEELPDSSENSNTYYII